MSAIHMLSTCPRLDMVWQLAGMDGIEFYTLRVCREPMNGLVVVYICQTYILTWTTIVNETGKDRFEASERFTNMIFEPTILPDQKRSVRSTRRGLCKRERQFIIDCYRRKSM